MGMTIPGNRQTLPRELMQSKRRALSCDLWRRRSSILESASTCRCPRVKSNTRTLLVPLRGNCWLIFCLKESLTGARSELAVTEADDESRRKMSERRRKFVSEATNIQVTLEGQQEALGTQIMLAEVHWMMLVIAEALENICTSGSTMLALICNRR